MPDTGSCSFPSSRIEQLEPRRMMSAVEPTAAEQYMLELVNQSRANPTAAAAAAGISLNEGLSPGTISADAKQPLAFNPALLTAARSHDNWMIAQNTFSHDEAGVMPGAQMSAAGYAFNGSYGWAQNISFQGSTGYPALAPTVALEEQSLFVDSTEPGRGHRTNLLDPNSKEVGIGVEQGLMQGYKSIVISQDFAYRAGNSFLTGVAYADANQNNFYDVGEGLGNVTITATRLSDNATFTVTTWSAGGYTLPLAPGTYTVTASGGGVGNVVDSNVTIGSQNVKLDFTPGQSEVPTQPVPTPIVVPDPVAPIAVQPTPPAYGWVTGNVFNDRNGNGARDRGEAGQGQWRIFVDLNGDGAWQRGEPFALTNSRGVYRLKLPVGDHQLTEVLKPRFIMTLPSTAPYDVTIDGGSTLGGMDFGNALIPKVGRSHHKDRKPL